MAAAYVAASLVQFPSVCPHCNRAAETSRALRAHSPFDVIVGEHGSSLSVWLPVCEAAARRRKWMGAAVFIGELAAILLGGLLAVAVSIQGHNTASVVIVVLSIGLVLPMRAGVDDMWLDSGLLGVSAWRPSLRSTRIRLRIRSDQYFSQWASMNPSASIGGGAHGWRPPPPPPSRAADRTVTFRRKEPALLLAATLGGIAGHHWYAKDSGHVLYPALCLMMAFAFLSAGGLVYPPLLWSLGVQGRHLPMPIKILGAMLGIAGLAAGFLLGISYRHR